MIARKRFGQHFLASPDIAARIVAFAKINNGDPVLEIGPGQGALTTILRQSGARLRVVELDRDLVVALKERWPDLDLIAADMMQADIDALCPGTGWKVVSNLPYNVGTHILMRLLRRPGPFTAMTLMFQKEVAERLSAAPDTDAYGALSVQAQVRARFERLLLLGPGAFRPPPKVDSLVIGVYPHTSPDFGGVAPEAFDALVNRAFSSRRKMLRNTLGPDRAWNEAICADAGITPTARAETLDLAAFRRLARAAQDRAQG